jgi:hypothetical protein
MILKLFSTGLCAFVPGPSGSVMVVLANALDHQHNAASESHYPAILSLEDHLQPSGGGSTPSTSREFDFGFDGTKTFGFQRMVGFLLDNELLEIEGATGPVSIDLTSRQGSCPTPKVDDRSLLWVAQMKDLDAAVMRSEAFYPSPNSTLVAAQVLLRGGSLGTSGFAKDNRGRTLKWEFKQEAKSKGEIRPLAEEVEYNIDLGAATSVRIQSSRTSGSVNRDIELFPDASGIVNCWLINQPLEDMLLNRLTIRTPIDHFVFFFSLAVGNPSSYIPFPVLDFCPPGVGGASNPRCPVAFFDTHE